MLPLDAFSLAANVMQFISFGFDLISKTNDIAKHGSLVEDKDLQRVNIDLMDLTTKLDSELLKCQTGLTEDERALHEVCAGCLDVSKQLHAALQKLEAKGKANKWKSFRKALKAIWGKEKLNELKSRLDMYSQQMDRRVLVRIR